MLARFVVIGRKEKEISGKSKRGRKRERARERERERAREREREREGRRVERKRVDAPVIDWQNVEGETK